VVRLWVEPSVSMPSHIRAEGRGRLYQSRLGFEPVSDPSPAREGWMLKLISDGAKPERLTRFSQAHPSRLISGRVSLPNREMNLKR
jgi:hypothetical protein